MEKRESSALAAFNSDKLLRWTLRLLLALLAALTLAAAVNGWREILTQRDLTGSSGDYGGYAAIARVNAQGGTIYRDAWTSKPPMIFFYLTPFVQLFGATLTAFNLALLVVTVTFVVVMTLLIYRLSGSWLGAAVGAGLAAVYAVWQDGPETTFLMSTFGAAAVLAAVHGRGRPLWLLLAGLLFAAGVLTKQPLALELPILLAFAAWGAPDKRWRAPLWVCVGGAVGLAALLLWAVSNDVLGLMWDRAFSQNVHYVAGGDGSWHFRPEFLEIMSEYFLGETLPYLLPLVALGIPAAFLLLRQPSRLIWLVVGWALLAFAGAAVGRALKPDYFTQMLPPMILLISLGALTAARLRIGWQIGLAALALVTLGWFVVNVVLENRKHGTMAREWAVVEVIEAHTPPDRCIWTWGAIGYISYLSDRDQCASPVNEGFLMDERAFPIIRNRIGYMEELLFSRPPILIARSTWGFFDELEHYAERYRREPLLELPTYQVYRVDTSAQHERYAGFGGEVALRGYDLPPQDTFCPGDRLALGLTWQTLRQPAHQYLFFVQLLTPDQTARLAGFDGVPSEERSTNEWLHAGEILFSDPFAIDLPADIAPGTYPLIAGLYEVETQQRLPAVDAAGAPIGDYALLQEIVVGDGC